ncbi:MAG: hypothetical protein R3183_09170 [Oleiphilaceae bacterium]|nr:hypothetical protein [Oleiphilaceae bacterium]
MLAVLVHICEAVLIGLIALLITRLVQLDARTNRSAQTMQNDAVEDLVEHIVVDRSQDQAFHYENKMESLKLAQSFAAMQMMAVKKEFGNIDTEELSWLRQAISLYLIGAADFIGKQHQCAIKGRKELIRMVLRSQLQLSSTTSQEYFDQAVHRQPLSDSDHMIRAGAKAAKMWLRNQTVPETLGLRSQLDEWGVLA